jgi:polyhydroxybutyrate depolymerase
MNGTQDPLMPFAGGPVASDRGQVISTRETAAWWVGMNGADPEAMSFRTLPDLDSDDGCLIQEEIYPALEGGAEVRLYVMEGGGHTLPSTRETGLIIGWLSPLFGPVCHDVDGTSLAWDFFQELASGTAPD